jgi:hypothetical protein
VICQNEAIQVGMWRLPDRILLAVYNSDEQAAKNVELSVDLDSLCLTPQLFWQEFIGLRQLHAEEKAPAPALDFLKRNLTLKGLKPTSGRLVMIRRY